MTRSRGNSAGGPNGRRASRTVVARIGWPRAAVCTPQLVHPPGGRPEFQQACRHRDGLPRTGTPSTAGFAPGGLGRHELDPGLVGQLAEAVLPDAVGRTHYVRPRPPSTSFRLESVRNCSASRAGGLGVAGEQDDAGDGPVEPVRDAEVDVAGFGTWSEVVFRPTLRARQPATPWVSSGAGFATARQ